MTGSRGLCEETLGSLEFAWPHRLSRRDPWAGDEVTPEPASYANYLSFGAASGEVALDEPEWVAQNIRKWFDTTISELSSQ